MRLFLIFVFIAVAVAALGVKPCLAKEGGSKFFQGIEILSGWGQALLKAQQDYHFIPLIVNFDFNLKELNQDLKSRFDRLLEFQIEPIFSLVLQPNQNVEAGNSFALKVGVLPETYEFQPYLKAGIGGIYTTQHIPEQATQLNFCEYLGLGFHYFFEKDTALTFEIRYRHISNADIKKPNKGISGYISLFGITRKF